MAFRRRKDVEQLLAPLVALFQWQNVALMVLGTFIGVIVGILPGIGAIQAMVLMIPITWKMDVTPAFILLISIYATSKFGGSLTAILFNIPGDNPNAVTLIDGFPMAKNGKARTAIGASATVSILGGLFSSLSVLIFMPVMYQLILLFGPAEFFMLALFGLTAVSAVSSTSIVKGLTSAGIGIMLSTVGFHPLMGENRYTFDSMYLGDGIHMVPVMLGLLAMSSAMRLWMEGSSIVGEGVPLSGSYKEGIKAVFNNIPLFIRSCLIAWVVGVAPGAGSAVAGFVSYASATKTCKNPETFGKGDVRGVIAGDTALHACAGGDILPTITMGIPGSGAMAVLLGAFVLHGITPGPQIIKFRVDIVYTIVYTIFVAHCISVAMALSLTGAMEKLTKMRAELISPIIVILCLLGSYMVRQYWQDMFVTTLCSIVGYVMVKNGYHPIPLLLGLILGPIAEIGFFEALALSRNGIFIFFTRIPSLILFLCIIAVIFWPYIERLYKKKPTSTA
jgi:putative tricarboxylic transport membrane protein